MDKKRILASAVVFLILAVLVFLQYREWRSFDWPTFWGQTHSIKGFRILYAVALIYFAYVLRAVRWKIFLRPVQPEAKILDLVFPTFVGFTGLALLGRAGEFIRPYLISRRTKLPFSSQLAVWAVERIFDVGAFAILIAFAVFRERGLHSVPHPDLYRWFYLGAGLLTGLVLITAVAAVAIRQSGAAIALWVERRFASLPSGLGHRLAQRVREFRAGLDTIHGPTSLLWLTLLSVGMWYVIARAYQQVTHSYGSDALDFPVLQILILMGASMIGSLLQLPAFGGGSQLATIKILSSVFDVQPELAASCGILLWLVTFAAVVPVGLILAHHERLSLRKLSEESHRSEEAETGTPPG